MGPFFSRLSTIIVAVGAIATALAIVPQLDDARRWITGAWGTIGTVEIDGTYPGESWKPAKKDQYSWLEDEWCYGSDPSFVSRFKLEGSELFRQNEGGRIYIKTEWVPVTVYISNHDVLRFKYPKDAAWPADFVDFDPALPAEWHEYTRNVHDDGSVSSNKKYLVVSCKRCAISSDGLIYNCS